MLLGALRAPAAWLVIFPGGPSPPDPHAPGDPPLSADRSAAGWGWVCHLRWHDPRTPALRVPCSRQIPLRWAGVRFATCGGTAPPDPTPVVAPTLVVAVGPRLVVRFPWSLAGGWGLGGVVLGGIYSSLPSE